MKRYDSYKDSGVECIGRIPNHWEIMRAKFACNHITDGSHFSPSTTYKGRNYVTASNVYNDRVYFEDSLKISEEDFKMLVANGCQPQKGDVLLTKDGSVGRSAIVDENNYVVLSSIGILTPRYLSSKILKYYLDSEVLQFQMRKAMAGAALKRITITKICDFIFPVPSLSEQQAIADYLDVKTAKIDGIIASREKKIKLLEELRSSIISEAVTKGIHKDVEMKDSDIEWIGKVPSHWEKYRFKNIAKLITTPSSNLIKIGLENIESGSGKYISTQSDFDGNGIAFKVKDIIYGKLRPYLRKVWLADFEGNAVGDFFVYRCYDNCLPEFLHFFMLSDGFSSACNGATFGAKMPRVPSDFISSRSLFLPQLTEQQAIVDYLDNQTAKIDKSIANARHEISLLKEYRASLITEVVTGKRKVTN